MFIKIKNMKREKVLIVKKNGYNIWGEMNPLTKKLNNFSISGVGVNPKAVYTYISDAENVVNRLTKNSK
jgi:hypothetical protein